MYRITVVFYNNHAVFIVVFNQKLKSRSPDYEEPKRFRRRVRRLTRDASPSRRPTADRSRFLFFSRRTLFGHFFDVRSFAFASFSRKSPGDERKCSLENDNNIRESIIPSHVVIKQSTVRASIAFERTFLFSRAAQQVCVYVGTPPDVVFRQDRAHRRSFYGHCRCGRE